jgi:hypothetical protein
MSNVATPVGGTQQSELVTVAINGVTIGVFDTLTGGDVTAPPTKFRSGGQYNETSYQTLPKYSDISVARVVNLAVDWEVIRGLRQLAGRVPMTVTVQPLDADLNAYGESQTATGLFLGVKGIHIDSNSEAIQEFTLDMSVDSWS